MVCWLFSVALLLAFLVLRRRVVRTRARQPECAACGYDLQGLSKESCCPECGGKERVRFPDRVLWLIRPRWEGLAVCAVAFVVTPLVYRFATVGGGALNYWRFEPLWAAVRNASMGWEESMRTSEWMPWAGFFASLATVWWRGKAAWVWLGFMLASITAEGVWKGFHSPAIHRMYWDGGGADDVPGVSFFVVVLASLVARGVFGAMAKHRVTVKQA